MTPSERRHDPVFPGFKEMAARRRALVGKLESRRIALGFTQTEVAARMGTSQSAVARLESGEADVRLSTIERYAAALSGELDWELRAIDTADTGTPARHLRDKIGGTTP